MTGKVNYNFLRLSAKALMRGTVSEILSCEKTKRVKAKNSSNSRAKIRLVSAEIADCLEKEILKGTFTVGQRLPSQAQLCQRFCVSVTAVREALHQLNARGLIRTPRGAGSFLAERSLIPLYGSLLHYARLASKVQDYSELMELRLMLETVCVEKVAASASPELTGVLQQCLAVMKRSPHDAAAFSRADTDFHSAIIGAVGNSLISTIHDALKPTIHYFMLRTYRDRAQFKRNCLEHQQIFDAILSGDSQRAGAEMRAHLAFGKRSNEALLLRDVQNEA
jgi:GntR family transcriptional repressor for pyruvate dehydrogenase complex